MASAPPTATAKDAIISIRGIHKYFQVGDVQVRALRGIDLDIEDGSYVAIMGPSGSGKSTMLNLLGCLDRPTMGEYFLGGDDVAKMDDDTLSAIRGKRLGFIFQSYNLIAQLTVVENIQVPLIYQQADLEEYGQRCRRPRQTRRPRRAPRPPPRPALRRPATARRHRPLTRQ